jgi:hypothetical protein
MSTGRQRFSIIPASAVTDARLEPRDLQVLCLLGRHTDDLGWCCRSQVKMAKELACGRATVQRALSRLVEAGYVEHRPKQRESGADAAHNFRVVIDPPEHGTTALESSADDGGGVPTGGQGGARDDESASPQESAGTLQNVDSDAQHTPGHPLPKGFEAGKTAENLGARDSGNDQNREARAPMLTTPVKRSERERAREDGEQEATDGDGRTGEGLDGDQRKRLKARLWQLAKRYPGSIADPLEKSVPIWLAMSEDERARAERHLPVFVATLAGPKGGMRRRPPLQEYLGERKFDMVETPEASAAASLDRLKAKLVQRFSRPWWWLWWDLMRRAEAGEAGGWQRLAQETTKAETTTLAWVVDPDRRGEIDAAAERLVQVARDGAEARAWAEWCRGLGRDGVHLPLPDAAPFVWVPSQWPPDEQEAWSARGATGTQDDDDRGVIL